MDKQVSISILQDIQEALNKDDWQIKTLKIVDIYEKNLKVSTSAKIKKLIEQQKELYAQDMTQARLAIQDARNEAYQSFRASNTDIYGNQLLTDSELWELANKEAN